jgi:hypothetical protein
MTFDELVKRIGDIHEKFGSHASKAVNVCLTGRNWLVGLHIKEYELQGTDRARYGARLYQTLAEKLASNLDTCYTPRYLQLCRQFYEITDFAICCPASLYEIVDFAIVVSPDDLNRRAILGSRFSAGHAPLLVVLYPLRRVDQGRAPPQARLL